MQTFAASLLAACACASEYKLASWYDIWYPVTSDLLTIEAMVTADAVGSFENYVDFYYDENDETDGYYFESFVNSYGDVVGYFDFALYPGDFTIGLTLWPYINFWDIDFLDNYFYFLQAEDAPCNWMGYGAEFLTAHLDIDLYLPACWISFYDLIDIDDKGSCYEYYDSYLEDVFVQSFAPENFRDKSGQYGYNTCDGANETDAPDLSDVVDAVEPTDETTY